MSIARTCELLDLRDPTLGWHGHLAVVLSPRQSGDDLVADWAADGVAHGEKVVYAYSGDEPSGLLSLLSERAGPAAANEALRGGHLEVVTMQEMDPLDEPDELVERALAEGFSAVRVSTDLSASLDHLGRSRTEKVERGLDVLCRTRQLSVLCRLAEATCSSGPVLLDAHAEGICGDSLAAVALPSGARIAGEVDVANEHIFFAVLQAFAPAGGRFRLDVTKLRFLSVGGARALVVATEASRRRGRVVLHRPAQVVQRVLATCGYEELFTYEWPAR